MIKEEDNNTKKPKIVFSPGSILSSILQQKSIIFKNIEQVSSEVFERFNELFGTENIIGLNEDIYETFFREDNKKIINLKTFKDKIIFIGTCQENSCLIQCFQDFQYFV